MNNSLVSVIVPIYNVEIYVGKCIESIINQSYKNLEIILIDDGSTDSSLSICKKYEKKDDRIKVIQKNNEGVSITRNLGIELSKGKYIQFIDSDDYIEKNMIEFLVKNIEKTNADLAMCAISIFNSNKKISEEKLNVSCKLCSIKEYLDILNTIKTGLICGSTWNKLYVSNVIKLNKIKFYESISYAEDFMFNMNYLKYVNLINIEGLDKIFYNYRKENKDSLTCKKKETFEWWKIQN